MGIPPDTLSPTSTAHDRCAVPSHQRMCRIADGAYDKDLVGVPLPKSTLAASPDALDTFFECIAA
eukprot:7155872-Prymnesium_polylepis.1